MKKFRILFLFFLSITTIANSQNSFILGFDAGYANGYCQDQGPGCIAPVPPIAPIPSVNESMNSYQDGYNRGFQMGLSAHTSNGNTSSNRTRYKAAASPIFIDGIGATDTGIKAAQLKYLIDKSKQDLISENYDEAILDARKMLAIEPNIPLAYFVISNAYYKQGDIFNAYNYAMKSDNLRGERTDWGLEIEIKTSELLAGYFRNNDYKNLVDFCRATTYPTYVTKTYLFLAYSNTSEYKKALDLYKELISSDTYKTDKEMRMIVNAGFFILKEKITIEFPK